MTLPNQRCPECLGNPCDSGDEPFCLVGSIKEREIADAEFIVRACNSHDDLLAACKALLRFFEGGNTSWQEAAAARAAIKKAEGR